MSSIFRTLTRGTSINARKPSASTPKKAVAPSDSACSVTSLSGEPLNQFLPKFSNFSSLASSLGSEFPNLVWICEALASRFKFESSLPIQSTAIPLLLQTKDILCIAPTGSGKTLAFIIAALALIKVEVPEFQAIILAPTVELVEQIKRECLYLIGPLSNVKVIAITRGASLKAHVGVATPKSLHNALHNEALELSHCRLVVIDEADVMFGDSHEQVLREALGKIKGFESMQKALFTCTKSAILSRVARQLLPSCVCVVVGSTIVGDGNQLGSEALKDVSGELVICKNIEQELVLVTNEQGKVPILKQMFTEGKLMPPILVFLKSIERVNSVYSQLLECPNLRVERFSSSCSVGQRGKIINEFRCGNIWMLLATNLLSRGIDFRGVSCVVNFDLPADREEYIARIGRVGRGTRTGKAYTLYTLDDVARMKGIVEVMKASGKEVPEWLCDAISSGGIPQEQKRRRHTHAD